jgi:hypothetical protein
MAMRPLYLEDTNPRAHPRFSHTRRALRPPGRNSLQIRRIRLSFVDSPGTKQPTQQPMLAVFLLPFFFRKGEEKKNYCEARQRAIVSVTGILARGSFDGKEDPRGSFDFPHIISEKITVSPTYLTSKSFEYVKQRTSMN